MSVKYYEGDSVRITAAFYDWNGALQDLAGVKCRLYNAGRQQIGTDITPTRVSLGTYQATVTLPSGYPSVTWEVSGTDSEGYPQLMRGELPTIWAQKGDV